MNNTIQNNLKMWDVIHDWSENGDEWKGQAKLCGISYPEWKGSVVQYLIEPYVGARAHALEIAPGHGRWTESLVTLCSQVTVVDLSPACIAYCRQRFAGSSNITYHVNDGSSLPMVPKDTIDFVWSYDAFVHMPPHAIKRYFAEFARVLKRGGHCIVHHAGRRHSTLWLGFTMSLGRRARRFYQGISMGSTDDTDGWRSNVSRELIAEFARSSGLRVVEQFQSWGPKGRYGAPRFNDCITRLVKT